MQIKYFDALTMAMSLLAEQPESIFLAQSCLYKGTAMYNTMRQIPEEQRHEMPVAEALQTGLAIGLSLQGYLPISCYPRINFLWSAADQLVNHLDKLHMMSQGECAPKVIIRTSVGSTSPLDPGPQHKFDTSDALAKLLDYIPVIKLLKAKDIIPEYQAALERKGSTVLVEYADKY